MLKKDRPNGVIVYEGPSQLDGSPIVVIATGLKNASQNPKTGDMINTWIIRSDIHPQNAQREGADISICGNCIHRGKFNPVSGRVEDRTCYVPMQNIFSVFHAYKRGTYKHINLQTLSLFEERHIRIGSYGDPAAVPAYVWRMICKVAKNHTGYTHQWKTCDTEYKNFCMASVESEAEYALANKMGWRTFRVILDEDAPLMLREIHCMAQSHNVQCVKCNFCNGASKNRLNAVVLAHGKDGLVKQMKKKLAKV